MDTNLSGRNFIPARVDQPPRATNRSARIHRVWLALLLALMIATATGVSPAQADESVRVSFDVIAAPQFPEKLCVGQQLQFYVAVSRVIHRTSNGHVENVPTGEVRGVTIHAEAADSNVGQVFPADRAISLRGEDDLVPLLPRGVDVGDAGFVFVATHPGSTTITFSSEVPRHWVRSDEPAGSGRMTTARRTRVEVVVRNCKFIVKTVSQWHLQGDASAFDISALMNPLELTADEQGNLQGSARVNGLGSATYPGCSGTLTVAPSQADLTGKLLESGQIELNITFTAVTSSVTFTCPAPLFTGVASRDDTGTPEALAVSMPDSGGVITQSQQIITTPAGVGFVDIIVIPVEAGGTASSPRLGSPLAWWTALWH